VLDPGKKLSVALTVSLGLGVAACGGSSRAKSKPDRLVVQESTTISPELGPIDEDDSAILNFGHAVSPRVESELIALTKRYYALALAGNGAKACSMLYSATATEVVVEQDDWGVSGKTCPVVMSKIFQQRHQQIAAELRSFNVVRVRSDGLSGYLVVRTPISPVAREFSARRVGRAWKVGQPLDRKMR